MTMGLLVEQAWQLYVRVKDSPFVVRPSIPVLFFGDSQRYFRSPLKVITVGLNPSRWEFPKTDPFTRFRRAQHVYPDILDGRRDADYLDALNDYFRCQPYRRWFNSFEPLLNGMRSSYYDDWTNTALHADLFSPIATDPTWSRLTDGQSKLNVEDLQLWHRLARHLDPDVIVISIARHYLGRLTFPVLRDWETVHTIERANPYRVEVQEVELTGGKRTMLVFGQAANTPFGKIMNSAKMAIGSRIADYVSER